ncbi:MAG: HAD-IIIC family phosphatase [Ferruginibacter sp.]
MKLRILSDVVFDPVIKELQKNVPGLVINYSYEEDIITPLLGSTENIDEKTVVFIHSDQHFHKKPVEWQKAYLSAILSFRSKSLNHLIFSNSLNQGFATKALAGSPGILADRDQFFSSYFSAILERSNTWVFDFNFLYNQLGSLNVYQYALGHLYQMPYTKQFIKLLAATLSEQLSWLQQEEKKAIIIDCDNTLWKGVIGEDGLDEIKCDNNAEGIIFYHFQLFLKSKKEEGFLLCICSKNNEREVKEAFDQKNMPLKWDDFIVRKINWDDKWDNIKKIAAELNIGGDSLIYIDDNPFELSSVSALATGISCVEFKEDYVSFLKMTDSFLFKRSRILDDDVAKNKQYVTKVQREKEAENYQNIDEFIQSLEIKLDVRFNDLEDLERLSQMTGKTNQFNFNKKLYSKDELTKLISGNTRIYSLKASDKFGSYGTVGLMLLKVDGDEAVIENFLMSCRALGKRIEKDFYNHVVQLTKQDNIHLVGIKFTPTLKNLPAQQFIKEHSLKIITYAD